MNIRGMRWAFLGLLIAIVALQPSAAHAYIGPGAGLTLLSAAVGFVVAIFSALGVILMWPVRMLVARLKRAYASPLPAPLADAAPEPLTRGDAATSKQ
jgi:hypothetical protein